MLTLYLILKFFGWIFKLMIALILLPFRIILWPFGIFRKKEKKAPSYEDGLFTGFIIGDLWD